MTSDTTEGSSTVPEKKSRAWVALYALNIILIFVVLVVMIVSGRRSRAADAKAPATGIPRFVSEAPAQTGSASENISRAEQLLAGGDLASALPVLGSVVNSGSEEALRAKALFMAGTAIAARSDQSDTAIQTLTYYVSQFPTQPGFPNAEYQLALLLLEQGEFDKAQTLLTRILRDYPDSPIASSAAYLAAQAADTNERANARANRRLGSALSSLLPSQSGPLGTFLATVLTTIVSTYLSYREKIHKGQSSTVILVLLLVGLATYSAFLNVRSQQEDSRALVASVAQNGRR